MKLKKCIAVLMCSVLFMMTGCGENTEGVQNDNQTSQNVDSTESKEADVTKEMVTLTIFNHNASNMPSNILDNPVMNKIAEETGVILDWSPFMGNNTADEAASMLIASNELPDIWLVNSPSINQTLLNNKLIISIDPYLDSFGKDIQEVAQDALDFTRFKFNTQENYFIPAQVGGINWYPSGYDNTFSYRYDLWEDMGKPELETYDDVINYCVEAMKLEPENEAGQKNYGVAIPLGSKEFGYLDWNFAHFIGQGDKNIFVNIDFEKDELVPRLAEDSAWLTGAEFFFKMNQAGALDPESATMNGDQVREKGGAQRYFLGLANWQIGWPNDKLVAAQDKEKGYAPLVVGDRGDYVFCRTSSPYGNGSYYAISKTCKDVEAAIRFINYTASWDGTEVMANGPEGTTWEYVDGKPKAFPNDPTVEKDPDAYKKIGISYVAPGLQVNGYREDPRGWKTSFAQEDNSTFRENMSAAELKFIDDNGYSYGTEYYDKNFEHNTFATPIFDMIAPLNPADELSVIETDATTLAIEYSVKLIYATDQTEFDKIKTEFLSELDRIGYQKGVDYYKEEYKLAKQKFEEFSK